MAITLTLIELAGAVALLLWGVHMVQTGVHRAFGAGLRQGLGQALAHRGRAFLAGLGVTAVLQSSTATGLMTASFAAGGHVGLVPALAVMLGANVGTTLIVQLLSFDVARVAPLFVLIGLLMFRRSAASRSRDLGRAVIGVGLMLLALRQLLAMITPYEDVPSLRLLMGGIATEPLVALAIGAAVTWAAHSSVAIVLLAMSFAARGALPLETACAVALGANLGTALNPLLEAASGTDVAGRRLALGNLLNRAAGCAIGLACLDWTAPLLHRMEPGAARAVADYHTAFNLIVAALFFPLLGPFARLLERLVPERMTIADPATPLYLDRAAYETPPIALAAAAREALRMADVLEVMLQGAREALDEPGRVRITGAKRMDDVLDRLNAVIKAYLTAMDPEDLQPSDNQRLAEILSFITNLEHAGDIVEKGLLAVAARQRKQGLAFSDEGRSEIRAMLERLETNLRTAAAVFMSDDARAARHLLGEKQVFRDLESQATETHFARVRAGRTQSMQTSAMHLDVLRDLKRINAHLAAAAYPVLERRGELLPSRLRTES